jgi:Flp pilus assembly protein TadG
MKTNNTKTSLKARNRRSRKGAAIVEFAVCIPLVVLIVFGSIEAASMIFLRQAAVQGAYEGAKVAIKPGSTNDEVQTAVDQVLAGRNLSNITLTLNPADVENVDPGEFITVSVSVPGDENSLFPFGPFKGRLVSADAVMVKE